MNNNIELDSPDTDDNFGDEIGMQDISQILNQSTTSNVNLKT